VSFVLPACQCYCNKLLWETIFCKHSSERLYRQCAGSRMRPPKPCPVPSHCLPKSQMVGSRRSCADQMSSLQSPRTKCQNEGRPYLAIHVSSHHTPKSRAVRSDYLCRLSPYAKTKGCSVWLFTSPPTLCQNRGQFNLTIYVSSCNMLKSRAIILDYLPLLALYVKTKGGHIRHFTSPRTVYKN